MQMVNSNWFSELSVGHLSTKEKNKQAIGAVSRPENGAQKPLSGTRPFWLKIIGLGEPGATFEHFWEKVAPGSQPVIFSLAHHGH